MFGLSEGVFLKMQPVVLIGTPDKLSVLVESFLFSMGVPHLSLDENYLVEASKVRQKTSCDTSSDIFEAIYKIESATGFLTTPFSINKDTTKTEDQNERYWSEWGAFMGGVLHRNGNALNPPYQGSWCGPHPTIFSQIATLERHYFKNLKAPSILELVDLFETNKFKIEGGGFCVPLKFWTETNSEDSLLEFSCCFIDDCIMYSDNPDSETKNLLFEICSTFRTEHNLRIGQVCIVKNSHNHLFRYAISRPRLDSFNWQQQASIVREIVKALL